MGLRDMILKAEDLPRLPCPTPEWPGTDGQVFIRTLSGAERDAFEQASVDIRRKGGPRAKLLNIRARFAALVCVDAEGNRVFQDQDARDLGRKSSKVLDRIWD